MNWKCHGGCLQARSGARVVVAGSVDMFSNAYFNSAGFKTSSGNKCAADLRPLCRDNESCMSCYHLKNALFEAAPGSHAWMLSKSVPQQPPGHHSSTSCMHLALHGALLPWHIPPVYLLCIACTSNCASSQHFIVAGK